MECAHLFAQIFATALEDDLALKLLGNFQMHRLENQSVTKKPPRAQSSLDSEVAHLVWDSDLTDLDSDEDLFANFGSDSGDESDDENDEHALVDAIMPLPNLWTPPKNEPFDLFCRMVPDKYHATLWQSTFWANETWWPTLCAFWNAQLQSTFFPDSATHISVDEAYDFAVLVLRQMRKVKPKKGTLEWLDVLQRSDLGKTICAIEDAATLIDPNNPHSEQLFLKIRAQDSLCETLDSWVEEAKTWKRTPVRFSPMPPEGARPLDFRYPGKPAWALWKIMLEKQNDNLIPRQKKPDSIEFLVSEDNFDLAWHNWLGLSLQVKGYDLCSIKVHELYASFMEILQQQYKKKALDGVVNSSWKKILIRTMEVRIMEKKAEEWVFAGRPRAPPVGKRKRSQHDNTSETSGHPDGTTLPQTACVECYQLPIQQHCRQTLVVESQDVEFLRGCGITMAPEGERMKPKPPPKSRANKPVPKIYTPTELRGLGLKFDGVERDEDVINRCKKQIILIKTPQGQLVDIVVYEAFLPEIVARLKAHHQAAYKCKPIKRGGQFDFYGTGDMVGSGSSAASGGRPGSGYAPIAGFEATTLDGIDLIFNEVEDATVMLAVMRAFHPDAHRLLISTTQAADRMGKSGTNTYKCKGYCSPQHSDDDPCRGLCTTTELRALPWEYAFCQPSYGYYLRTYENMLW
ncbi:hypothetical protein FB451DRAFT_1441105 [Mycena latifolia]|nr:hypothetical protein FB451DRAFT_1441105 [Mycena latifolia]